MARAKIDSVELEYDERGTGEPLVLVMGIGAQMIFWDDALIDGFVDAGFRVIRFDHRDIGLSSRLDHLPVPRPLRVIGRRLLGLPVDAPYTLSDMAADVIGLLDHLGIDRAHVVGVSMGGMVVQHLAIEHPTRIKTMTSIMSTTGAMGLRALDQLPAPAALKALLGPRPRTADEAADNIVRTFRVIGATASGDPAEETRLRAIGRQAFERGISARGFLRHFAAIAASGDRTKRLRGVRTPTLVIHGGRDPLIRPASGRATAAAIPGARYLEIPDMAHHMPRARWPEITSAIVAHAKQA